MKKGIPILVLFVSLSFNSNSQILKGDWQGLFVADNKEIPINLEFILNPDSTYTVYSFTKVYNPHGKDYVITCRVTYELLPHDSIYLEEKETIEPYFDKSNCFQKMYLRIKRLKSGIILDGQWETSSPNCLPSGSIYFQRPKKKKIKNKKLNGNNQSNH